MLKRFTVRRVGEFTVSTCGTSWAIYVTREAGTAVWVAYVAAWWRAGWAGLPWWGGPCGTRGVWAWALGPMTVGRVDVRPAAVGRAATQGTHADGDRTVAPGRAAAGRS